MLRRLVALIALLSLPTFAVAHGLDLARTLANGTLTVTLTYDDDEPCGGAVVKVLNAAGEAVAEGKTDDRGVCVLTAPPPGEYTIRAKTDDGHAAKGALTVTADPDPDQPETVSTRPPRLLYLGLGLAGIGLATVVFFWLGRRKRPAGPSAD